MIHRWKYELAMQMIVPLLAVLILIWFCYLVYRYLPIHLTLLYS